jgi:Arylsulfotransferase (ASST)
VPARLQAVIIRVRPANLLGALVAVAFALASASAASAQPLVAVYPSPDTSYNNPATQITFRGLPASQIGSVTVTGSATGPHTGHIAADSDGYGGSFLPDKPFQAGETVTVMTSLDVIGGHNGAFTFKIEHPSKPITPTSLPVVPNTYSAVQHFRSEPGLLPSAVWVSKDTAPASEGDIFVAPQYGPVQNGPMILDSSGRLVWFEPFPVSQKLIVTDFRTQNLYGQPVLTWFQGYTDHGSGVGEGVILNQNYQQVAVVQAGNGFQMDLHEFLVTPQGQAYLLAVSPVSLPNVVNKPVLDAVVQEIDIKTGLVLYEWHALDHIPFGDSYFPLKSPGYVYDPYHANSVGVDRQNNPVVSLRDTSAVYKIDRATGRVVWELGGKHPSFSMGSGTSIAFQHDAVVQPDGTVTIFDDGAGPPTLQPYSHGIRVAVNASRHTASLVRSYDHSPRISANFEGSVQDLPDGSVFLGWGQQPYFSEDNAAGQQIFDGHFYEPTSSYRAYRFVWNGQPLDAPALSVGTAWRGIPYLWASWNGATDVARWQVLAGTSSGWLAPIGSVARDGFETAFSANTEAPYFAVQALGGSGQVLAQSAVASVPRHVEAYGASVFVPPASGFGGIPVGCFTGAPCRLTTTITSGRTVIAQTGGESMGTNANGIGYFRLSSAGRSMLAHARNHRLAVQVLIRDGSGVQLATPLTLVAFSTAGHGPARSLSGSSLVGLMGTTDFVNSNGVGGLLTGCRAAVAPCPVSATISIGRTVIARTGREAVGAGDLGYVFFSLTSAGRSMLDHAGGNQLGAQVNLTSGSQTASGRIALVRFS